MSGVLITRPNPAAQQTARDLQEMGFTPYSAPTLKIEPYDCTLPEASRYAALIFTSAQAIKHLMAHPQFSPTYLSLPALCVGDKTQSTAIKHGFTRAISASGNAHDLLALIKLHHADNAPNLPYLYLRGKNTSQPLEEWMNAENIKNHSIIIYQATPTETLEPPIIQAIKDQKISYVLFFSGRSAESFVTLVKKHTLQNNLSHIKALSISNSVLGYVQELGWERTLHADTPDKQGLYDLLQRDNLKAL